MNYGYKKIASGWRGIILLDNQNKIALKKAKNNTKKAAINKEITILNKLKKYNLNFVPHIIDYGDGRFKYNRIEGITLKDYLKHLKDKKQILNKLLDKIYLLDKIGIIHGEMIRPYTNILVDRNENIYIIDFERGKINDFSGKNMRSFAQYLSANNFVKLNIIKNLGKQNIDSIYKILKKHLSNN